MSHEDSVARDGIFAAQIHPTRQLI